MGDRLPKEALDEQGSEAGKAKLAPVNIADEDEADSWYVIDCPVEAEGKAEYEGGAVPQENEELVLAVSLNEDGIASRDDDNELLACKGNESVEESEPVDPLRSGSPLTELVENELAVMVDVDDKVDEMDAVEEVEDVEEAKEDGVVKNFSGCIGVGLEEEEEEEGEGE